MFYKPSADCGNIDKWQHYGKNCNCVAFRLDDVQDYWLSNSQMQIINLFQEKEIPLTIGIVGGLIGEDDVIVNFLKEKLAPGNPHLELANHSWSDIRLTEMTKSEQNTAIQLTNEKIFEIFSWDDLTTGWG